MEYNDHRQQAGIPLLPGSWKISSAASDYTVWVNPDADRLLKEGKPLYFSKSIKYDLKGGLISEEDMYYSGKLFNTPDGSTNETVSVAYYYIPQKIAGAEVRGWHCVYIGPEKEISSEKKDPEKTFIFLPEALPLARADSILKSWDIAIPMR
jgi:hypothetical protein